MSDVPRMRVFPHESAPSSAGPQCLHLRKPVPTDGPRVFELVSACAPLDVNSLYCYLILCAHFQDTCCIAECGGEIVGFVSGYREPARPDVFFCWQVAVAARLRRSGIAIAMLRSILSDPTNRGVRTLEATVTSANHPSMGLFRRLAAELGSACHVEVLFSEPHFAPWEHEAEWLMRIGSFELASDHDPLEAARDREPGRFEHASDLVQCGLPGVVAPPKTPSSERVPNPQS